jgi:dephospho-CoA kinase
MTLPQPLTIGITGGVGSGKSTAVTLISTHFENIHIDLDAIGHQLLETSQIKKALVDTFGQDILTNTQINRQHLGSIVFGNPKALKMLNQLMHPAIKVEVLHKIAHHQGLFQHHPIILINGALLIEIGLKEQCHAIIAIETDPKKRLEATGDRFTKIAPTQMTPSQYRAHATHIVKNDYTPQFEIDLIHTITTIKEKR